MSATSQICMLTRYKAWANEIIYSLVHALSEVEALRQRATRFGNMVHTLNHVYVIDSVFKAHLLGKKHGYTSRNTLTHPPVGELWSAVQTLNKWYVDFADALSPAALEKTIEFEFIGGGQGAMRVDEMILHVVNHGTYHRGFVGDMMYQAGVTPEAKDLPVFLRDTKQS
jgi:uncharacterized damage-inducible protein DinB